MTSYGMGIGEAGNGKASNRQSKTNFRLQMAAVVVACLTFFALGYVSGFFTPRTVAEFVSPALESARTKGSAWLDGSCPVMDSANCPAGYQASPPLLVISVDGFRSDYMGRRNIPAFKRIAECGVHAPSMRPSYPSSTFPNHYSIATGLFSESHGIVDNTFFDPELNRTFSYGTESVWWNGEPIWVTAKKQGKRAHSYFFVGSEAEIQGIRPDEWLLFDKSHPYEQRVDKVLDWLSLNDSVRPDVTTMYFEEPDSIGHLHGTESSQLTQTLTGMVNSAIDRLMQGLVDRNILQCVNILVVSDHGMHNCEKSQIGIQPLIEASPLAGKLKSTDYYLRGGATGRIYLYPSAGNVTDEQVYHALQCKAPSPGGEYSPYQVYRKRDFPRRLHFTNTVRVEPTLLNLQAGYSLSKTAGRCSGGMHGFDNLYPNMEAIFLAQGPSFKSGLTVEPFQNIELYNLMCDLVNVKPAPNNGTYGSLHHILRAHNPLPDTAPDHSQRAVYPDDKKEVQRRRELSCWTACPDNNGNASEADELLHISEADATQRLSTAAPYGIPQSTTLTSTLVNRDYAVGYAPSLQLPAWINFSVDNTTELKFGSFSLTCSRNDVRLSPEQTLTCKDFPNSSSTVIQPVYLFPADLASPAHPSIDVKLVSNVVPMYNTFRNGVWADFWRIFGVWSLQDWKLNVVTGPVFDSVAPYGLADPPENHTFSAEFPKLRMPSHYFVVVTREERKNDCVGEACLPSVLAFLLPHTSEVRPLCQDIESYILTHSATVRDVESITGLRFYASLPQYDAIRLRTQLPIRLWHRKSGLGNP